VASLHGTAKFTVSRNVSGVLARVSTGLYEGINNASEVVKETAKGYCPVDTGLLQSSITANVTRGIQLAMAGGPISDSLFAVQGVIAPHTDYASYVEYGTGQRGSPAPYAHTDKPGMRAQPYMRPALDEHREDVIDLVRYALKDALS